MKPEKRPYGKKLPRPILLGVIRTHPEGNTIDVWCPHCQRLHHHGWPENSLDSRTSTIGNHRVAHCHDDSPIKDGGYYIGVMPNTVPVPHTF